MNINRKPKTTNITIGALPASSKIFVAGQQHPNVRVPMREISLHESANEPPLVVYDTSGAYTDPNVNIDFDHHKIGMCNH